MSKGASPTKLDKWATRYATHSNENPLCFDGRCRCAEWLNDHGRELLAEYGVQL